MNALWSSGQGRKTAAMEAAARRLAALTHHTSPRPPSRGAAHSPLPSHTGASGVGEGAEAGPGWDPSTIFDEGNAITGGYYGHKGLLSPLPAVQAELDRLSTAELAAASVPRCLQGEDLPVLWGRSRAGGSGAAAKTHRMFGFGLTATAW